MKQLHADDRPSALRQRAVRNVRWAILVTGIVIACIYGTRPLVALHAQTLGASPFDIGLLTAAFSLLPALLIVPLAHWTRHIPLTVRVLFATMLASAGLLLPYLAPSILGLYASQLMSGMSFAVVLVVTVAFIEENSSPASRDINVSRYMIANAFGTFLGPSLGGIVSEHVGFGEAFAAAAVLGMAASALSLFLVAGDSHTSETKDGSTRTALNLMKRLDLRRALYISALVLTAKDLYVAYFPLVGSELGMSATTIGLIISVNSLAGIFVRWLMPRLTARLGHVVVLASSFALSGFFFVMLPLFDRTAMLFAISFLLGLGLGIGQPISVSATLAALPKDQVSTGLGLRIMFNRMSQVSAPLIFGSMAHMVGIASIFATLGAIFLAGAWKVGADGDPNNRTRPI